MKRPRKAIVLAAGHGSRLAPLTLDCPKPLIPVRGQPLIQTLFQELQQWGVREVLVNIHHRADLLFAALPDLCPRGMQLSISYEPTLLGTGGALRRMAWFWDDQPMWICNADVVQQLSPRPLLAAMEKQNPLACLWMIPDHGPRTVDVQDGVIQSFRSSGMTFSGLHLARKDLLDFLPREETFCSVIPAYEAAMKQGHTVLGIPVAGSSWEDAGTPERLLAVNGSSICFPGSQVSKRVTLDQALVGPGTRLRARRKVSGVVLSPARGLTPAEQQRCPDAEAVEELPARGSDRSFARIHFSERTFIRIRSGQQRPENRRTAGHLRFLARQGIPVPKVHYASRDGSLLLLEDGGTEHLLDRLQQGSAPRNRNDMQQALKVTADLHAIRVPSRLELEPPFSPRLYHWEHQLFFREFLSRFDPDADLEALNRSLQKVARGLQKRPKVLLHRDLQSTNFLWTAKGPMLIDVQGMRKGPAAYDLASLLADPYVNRSPEEQRHLLRSYETYSGTLVPLEIYALGATQRLVQALGAYGRLGAQPETRRFLVHVPAALQQLQVWAPVGPLQRWAETFLQNWTEPQP